MSETRKIGDLIIQPHQWMDKPLTLVPPLPPGENAKAWQAQFEILKDEIENGNYQAAMDWLDAAIRKLQK